MTFLEEQTCVQLFVGENTKMDMKELKTYFKRKINMCNLAKVTTLIVFDIYISYVSGSYEKKNGIFYILLWTNGDDNTFVFLEEQDKSFIHNKCQFQNCFITNSTSYLTSLAEYDALLFNAVTLHEEPTISLPDLRSPNQNYVLVAVESAANSPLTAKYNNFFNWTWTYKLNSDINIGYILTTRKDGTVIGPKEEMHWIPIAKMVRTSIDTVRKMQHKQFAVAWIVSNCDIMINKYESYIADLRNELRNYKHTLNVFGECGNMKCPNDDVKQCKELIESRYYFYLAFEDSMAEDYVTDQLLIALHNFAVPVVFGGANYTRFMPDGIYLDALELGPTKLAKEMNDIINNRPSYYDMFKWHNYYSYYDPLSFPETSGVCELCALLNNEQRRKERRTYTNIVKWFNDRKDWNYGQKNEPVVTKLTIHEKNAINISRTSLPKRKKQNMENIKPTHDEAIENESRNISYSDNSISQGDDNVVIYNDIATTPSDKYKIRNEYNSNVLRFVDGDEKFFDENNDEYNDYNRRKPAKNRGRKHKRKHHKSNKRLTKTKTEDTSIRCPNIGTCLHTIVNNMKTKIASWFSVQ